MNFKKYFLYALLIKAVLFFAFVFSFNKDHKDRNINYIFHYTSDYKSYIMPAVNLIDLGTMYEGEGQPEKKLYAHKMPGLVPIFAPLYYFFGFSWGISFFVIIQFSIDALCCVLLGKIALRIFNDKHAFYIAFFLYAFSSIVSVSTHFAVSELFCTSFCILTVYFILFGKNKRNLLLAGLFATWAIFLRPMSILLLFCLPLFLALDQDQKFSFKQLFKNRVSVLLVLLPFTIFESLWIARNFKVMKAFVPAETVMQTFGTPGMKAIFSMLLDMGGDLQSWNPDSEMLWFCSYPGAQLYNKEYADSNPFQPNLAKAGIQLQELRFLRSMYGMYCDSAVPQATKQQLESGIILVSKSISIRFKTNAPFYHHVVAPLRTLKTLVFIKRPYGFVFATNGLLEKGIRRWHFICYYLPLILFFPVFFRAVRKKNNQILIVAFFVFLHVFAYGFILRLSENRYLVPVYPFLILGAVATIIYINQFFVQRRLKFDEPLEK